MNRSSPLRIYLPWILLCVALAGSILLVARPADAPDPLVETDLEIAPGTKITSARSFAGLLARQDKVPLHEDDQYRELTAGGVYPIHIEFDPRTWRLMVNPENRRFYKERPSDAIVRFGDRSRQPAVISVRGRGSLKMENKPNFRVRLARSEAFAEDIEMRTFYLMNMEYDRAEYLLAWTYRLLEELDLFYLYTRYVRVTVNGEPLGIYLLVEPPEDGIRRAFPGTVAIYRRRYASLFTREWEDAVADGDHSLSALVDLNQRENIPDALAAYRRVIDIDQYFRWLAINSILCNMDSLDEVFLFEVREDKETPRPMRMMAWDYDDIASEIQKSVGIDHPLLWSALGDIDRVILDDPALFGRYREILREMLVEVPAARLERIMTETFEHRQSLDDGRPAEVQAAFREESREIFAVHRERILARHARLCELLGVEG